MKTPAIVPGFLIVEWREPTASRSFGKVSPYREMSGTRRPRDRLRLGDRVGFFFGVNRYTPLGSSVYVHALRRSAAPAAATIRKGRETCS